MDYVTIRDGLYLVRQPVDLATPIQVPVATQHLFIVDRSGSMTWTIDAVMDHVRERLHSLPDGDYVTLGYFSGPGECRFVLKGCPASAKDRLDPALDALRSTLSTTCFSEILEDANTVIEELTPLSARFALTLFTDGCPVVDNLQAEHAAMTAALHTLGPRLTSALLVGYGRYYNKALMTRMAELVSGDLVHADSVRTFAVQYDAFCAHVSQAPARVPVIVGLPVTALLPFSVAAGQITVYRFHEDGQTIAYAPHGDARLSEGVYYLTETQPPGGYEITCDTAANGLISQRLERMIQGAYAAACLLTQRGAADTAVEILGALGDVALVDAVMQAFTLEEMGQVETQLRAAVTTPGTRFTRGRDTAYVPRADTVCVLDVLDRLMGDPTAAFYPRHPAFVYHRIGPAQRPINDEMGSRFTADASVGCAFTTLTWHERLLNLSVLARIPGTVRLQDDAALLGFANPYPTQIWRNYAIVKDGFLNTPHLPVSCSQHTFDWLQQAGVLDTTEVWTGLQQVHVLHLEHIPVMNRALARAYPSAAQLCRWRMEELALMALLKVLRHQVERLADTTPAWTTAQEQYLARYDITRHGYRPATVPAPTTDFYLAKAFRIIVKGYSTLPPVERVAEKLARGIMRADVTRTEMLIAQGLRFWEAHASRHDPLRTWLEEEIQRQTQQLTRVRSQMQRAKFAVLLGKAWFDDLPSRSTTMLDIDGVQYTFDVRDDVRVEV